MNEASRAHVKSINGAVVTGVVKGAVSMNEVVYILLDDGDKKRGSFKKLKAEVIRIRNHEFDAHVFEDTTDIRVGQVIELSRALLSIELGPGLLGAIFDGHLNPLTKFDGFFLKRGTYIDTLHKQTQFEFMPVAKIHDIVTGGQTLGLVKEGSFSHRIMVPFALHGCFKVVDIALKSTVTVASVIARLENTETRLCHDVTLSQRWPIKTPLNAHAEKLGTKDLLTTSIRMIDSLFPIALGGTVSIAGPCGSGKTTLVHNVSLYSDVDIVIMAACGGRSSEVIEIANLLAKTHDPKTGGSLMQRTVLISNTAAMPIMGREASVYSAMAVGEYYRHMGFKVLVLIDSLSRWAEALRETTGSLFEIPGEEGYPVYLNSLVTSFYERAGVVRIDDKNLSPTHGSLTLMCTVSSHYFDDQVTKSVRLASGSFLGLTEQRSSVWRFPSIAPLDSWSKYAETKACLKEYYEVGQTISHRMEIMGEEGIELSDFVYFLKSLFFDKAFLEQQAFESSSKERSAALLQQVQSVIEHDFSFRDKEEARSTFLHLTSLLCNLHLTDEGSREYGECLAIIKDMMAKNARSYQ